MTNNHLKKVLTLYYNRWKDSYPPKRMDTEQFFGDRTTVMAHAMWMCQEALEFFSSDPDKAHRWLGFIQGIMFCVGHYSIDEMRAHSTEPTDP